MMLIDEVPTKTQVATPILPGKKKKKKKEFRERRYPFSLRTVLAMHIAKHKNEERRKDVKSQEEHAHHRCFRDGIGDFDGCLQDRRNAATRKAETRAQRCNNRLGDEGE